MAHSRGTEIASSASGRSVALTVGFDKGSGPDIPRRIWFLWFQGLDSAPYVVKRCYESWLSKNEGWEVVPLSYENISAWLDFDVNSGRFLHISRNHLANIVRLALLSQYGGVWADATCLCVRSLDSWLSDCLPSGFFAFEHPARDRMVENWFLAASPGNVLVSRWNEEQIRYWGDHDFRPWKRDDYWMRRMLGWNSRTTSLWFSHLVQNMLKVCPYFAADYLFQRLVRSDHECRDIWNRTPRFSAEVGLRLYRAGLDSPLSSNIRHEIANDVTPLYKLSWKRPDDLPRKGSVLEYVLASNESAQ